MPKERREPYFGLLQLGKELEKERDIIEKKAKEIGLQQYPSVDYRIRSRIWVKGEPQFGEVPDLFYLERGSREEKEELKKYRLNFPINDISEFADAMDTLDAFYHGVAETHTDTEVGRGLLNFLKDFQKRIPKAQKPTNEEKRDIISREYTEEEIVEFMKSDELDEEARRIKEKFKGKMPRK